MSENLNKTVQYDNFIYSLNDDEKTASIYRCNSMSYFLTIPYSINHESTEYIITNILPYAFQQSGARSIKFASNTELQKIDNSSFAKSIITEIYIPSSVKIICNGSFYFCEQLQFVIIPQDSQLQTIESFAFCMSSISFITITSQLTNLEDGWCIYTRKLNSIDISPNNPKYKNYEDKYIIGKLNENQEDFDVLVFCVRNIETATIPNFIKHIESDAFSGCKKLKHVVIPDDSLLQTIGERIFDDTPIESFTIPSNVVELKNGWCASPNLKRVFVNPENKMFKRIQNNFIIGKSSIDLDFFECFVFCDRLIKYFEVPNYIRYIKSCAFSDCNHLERIDFEYNSKLEIIEKKAFRNTKISSISIPCNVKQICEEAFQFCVKLNIIEVNDILDPKSFNFIKKDLLNNVIWMIPACLGKRLKLRKKNINK